MLKVVLPQKHKNDITKIRIEQRWIINQKDPLQIWADWTLFETKGNIRIFYRYRPTKTSFIELSIGSIYSQKKLLEYFKLHPLKTIKYKALIKWHYLYLYRTNTLPNSPLSDHQLKQKIKQMAKKVNHFNHLK